jgi:hypothetical protein
MPDMSLTFNFGSSSIGRTLGSQPRERGSTPRGPANLAASSNGLGTLVFSEINVGSNPIVATISACDGNW